MLFVRHPELGKVKTRLAKDLGDEKALAIYIKLLEHTKSITTGIKADKLIYYAEEVQEQDLWDNDVYHKKAQGQGNLGQRMEQAFLSAFENGYKSVIIIGSDCLQLNEQIIEQAFYELEGKDVVVGPATDGGYYLLGMKQLHSSLFENKPWSTDQVLTETLTVLKQNKLSYTLMPVLSDIDHAEDVDAALLL
jgi:uncharacterized protein